MEINKSARAQAIDQFWSWFGTHASNLIALYSSRQFAVLTKQMGSALDKIDPRLAWEMGPGNEKPYLLTISSEGDPDVRRTADLMVQSAPTLDEWELYSSTPARPAPKAVQLSACGPIFETSDWKFLPIERPETGRLDLIVISEELAEARRTTALHAVSIYLDQLLGEDTVERWIGTLAVQSPTVLSNAKKYSIAELPDYLLWITNRDESPLRPSA